MAGLSGQYVLGTLTGFLSGGGNPGSGTAATPEQYQSIAGKWQQLFHIRHTLLKIRMVNVPTAYILCLSFSNGLDVDIYMILSFQIASCDYVSS